MINRTENELFESLALSLGLPAKEVRRAVHSFFSVLVQQADSLPFNTHRKIYSKDAFNSIVKIHHLPCLGRLGPVYSRYLKWRSNESLAVSMVPRSSCRRKMTQGDIENIAADILAGRTPFIVKRKGNEMYNRVWLVGQDGKKSARQVILKNENDV